MARMTPGTPCGDCERPIRPPHSKLEDYPGTVLIGGHGLCNACLKRRHRRQGTVTWTTADLPGLESDDPKVRRDAWNLHSYMERRREG